MNCFLKCSSSSQIYYNPYKNYFDFNVSYNDAILYNKFGITCPKITLTWSDAEDKFNEMKIKHEIFDQLIVQNGIIFIADYAFFYKYNIKHISLPTTITSIGSYSFKSGSSLTSIIIPTSLKTIGDYCFEKCCLLSLITFQSEHISFGQRCFKDCTILKRIYNSPNHCY